MGKKIKDKKEDLKNFYLLNTMPATAQLLRARVIDDNGNVAINTFLNGSNSPYQQMINFSSSPNQPIYDFVATAQGSQCGVPVMASDGLSFANYDGEFAVMRFWLPVYPIPGLPLPIFGSSKYFLKTQLTALPTTGIAQIEYYKFSRRIALWGIGFGTKTINEYNRFNPAGFVQWDAAPGSTQSIKARTNGALNTGLTSQDVPWYATPFVAVGAGLNINITQDLFSFVSTTSALDAPAGTPLNTAFLFQITGTANTSAKEYIAQKRFMSGGKNYYNANHTDFTARNALWIFNEMQDENQVYDCDDYCDLNQIPIVGNATLCTCETYTINSLPQGATVTWSVYPTGRVSLTPDGQSVTVCRILDGTITLTATINSPTCGNSTLTKTIQVGLPYITQNAGSGSYTPFPDDLEPGEEPPVNQICTGQQISLSVNVERASGVTWSRTSALPTNTTWSQTGNTLSFYLWGNDQRATFQVSASNSCGVAQESFSFKSIGCGGGDPGDPDPCKQFVVSPNPASGNINVYVPNIPPPCDDPPIIISKTGKSKIERGITQVRLYDNLGNLKKQQTAAKTTQLSINISGLTPGIYYLEIFDGTFKERQKVVIQ